MDTKIEYPYVDEGTPMTGEWEGEEADAIQEAVEHLRAEQDGDSWTYHDEAVGEDFRVDRDGMLAAGAAILDDRSDWFSYWCTHYGEPLL